MAWLIKNIQDKILLVFLIILYVFSISIVCIYHLDEENMVIGRLRIIIQLTGIFLAVLALHIAYLNYKRKSGTKLRATYLLDNFIGINRGISWITLINEKDKTEVVYKIYVQSGNKKILIKDAQEKPIIIAGYSAENIFIYGGINNLQVAYYRDHATGMEFMGENYEFRKDNKVFVLNAKMQLIEVELITSDKTVSESELVSTLIFGQEILNEEHNYFTLRADGFLGDDASGFFYGDLYEKLEKYAEANNSYLEGQKDISK